MGGGGGEVKRGGGGGVASFIYLSAVDKRLEKKI